MEIRGVHALGRLIASSISRNWCISLNVSSFFAFWNLWVQLGLGNRAKCTLIKFLVNFPSAHAAHAK